MFKLLFNANCLNRKSLNFINFRSIHIKEQKIKLNDVNINYVRSGEGEKSVLLLPGALGTAWTDFKPQIEKLPALLPNHTIIAWDPPGYGKSTPPKRKFDLEMFRNDAQCAVELMKHLERPKFSALGWSDGGITALIIAGRYESVLEKLIIWGAAAYLNADEVKMIKDMRDVSKWSPRMREPMEKMYGAAAFAEMWGAWVDASVEFYTENNGDFCRTEVDRLKVPAFILHGKKDPMIAAEHIPYLLQHIRGVKYHEFPDGKHNIHLRYADEFNKLVADFLLGKC